MNGQLFRLEVRRTLVFISAFRFQTNQRHRDFVLASEWVQVSAGSERAAQISISGWVGALCVSDRSKVTNRTHVEGDANKEKNNKPTVHEHKRPNKGHISERLALQTRSNDLCIFRVKNHFMSSRLTIQRIERPNSGIDRSSI